jgi:hypothetical protein
MTSLRDAEWSTRSSAASRVTSRATCRGTQTRGGGEVVDDESTRGGEVDDEQHDKLRDEPRDVSRHPDARRCEVVDDEPRDMLKQPEARRRKIDSALTRAR